MTTLAAYVAIALQHSGILPKRLRLASAMAAAGVYPGAGATMMWVLTGIFLLGAVINALSRSPIERWWAVVALPVAGWRARGVRITNGRGPLRERA